MAYVEAEYFGGVGTQAAAVWDARDLALGPLIEAEDPLAAERPFPISQALRRLGVSAQGYVDEFEAVGLDKHRDMDDWLKEALYCSDGSREDRHFCFCRGARETCEHC